MALTQKDIRAIADYARIALPEEELEAMTKYMNDIVASLDQIKTKNLDGVAPTFHPIGDLANVMREDQPKDSLTIEDALQNAGMKEGRSFKVPTILSADH